MVSMWLSGICDSEIMHSCTQNYLVCILFWKKNVGMVFRALTRYDGPSTTK